MVNAISPRCHKCGEEVRFPVRLPEGEFHFFCAPVKPVVRKGWVPA